MVQEAQQVLTGGDFATEDAAWDAFDRVVEANGAFRSFREVRGEYLQPRPDTEHKDSRIDRILIPLPRAIEAGWTYGAIGIEGKKSGTKVGRLICQAMDYTRCVFELEQYPAGLLLMCKWVFVYPMEKPFGDLESVMTQHRIGYVCHRTRGICFGCGSTNGLILNDDGSLKVANDLPMGRKRGSR